MSVRHYAYHFFGAKLTKQGLNWEDLKTRYAQAVLPEYRLARGTLDIPWRKTDEALKNSGCDVIQNGDSDTPAVYNTFIVATPSVITVRSDEEDQTVVVQAPNQEVLDEWTANIKNMCRAIDQEYEGPQWYLISHASY
jgi:hypothetical protein